MKGICFKEEMFKAIIDGTKTPTRRVIKPQPIIDEIIPTTNIKSGLFTYKKAFYDEQQLINYASRYKVDEIVYLKEPYYAYGYWRKQGLTKKYKTAWVFVVIAPKDIKYLSNKPANILSGMSEKIGWYKRNKLFMPEKYARYFIKIKDIKVEKLQDISGLDAVYKFELMEKQNETH